MSLQSSLSYSFISFSRCGAAKDRKHKTMRKGMKEPTKCFIVGKFKVQVKVSCINLLPVLNHALDTE